MADVSFKNDNEVDERLNPSTHPSEEALKLKRAEATASANPNFEAIAAGYNKTADPTQENANMAKARESWSTNVSSGNGKKKKGWLKGGKKGPMGLIISLLLGGGGGLTLLISPGIALIHVKEAIVNKLESISSVEGARSDLIMPKRIFSTGGACGVIKVYCRYNGMTTRQMARLRIQGGDILDGNGKPITQNKVTRKWSGGKTLTYTNEKGEKVRVTPSSYKKLVLVDPKLRSLGRSVFAPRFWSFNDSISKQIRADKRLQTDPKLGKEGDQQDAEKSIIAATKGDTAPTVGSDATAQKDKNGKPIAADPGSAGLDFGSDAADIQALATQLSDDSAAGKAIPNLPSDPAGAASMPDFTGASSLKKGLKSALGFLNPLGFLTGLCTVYQLTNAIVLTAHIIVLANDMRYASVFLSVADKVKAGDGTGDDVEKLMNILESVDQYGDAFGESFGYNFVQYGSIIDKSLASSAEGNDVIRLFSTILNTTNSALGGASTVKTACNILTNPYVQGALVLTSFIPGGGQIVHVIAKLAEKGGMDAAKKIIEEKIAGMASKTLTKDAFKTAASAASKGLWNMAKSPGLAMFLGGFIMAKYGVPYIARAISGTDLANANGVTSFDTVANGFDAINSTTAQSHGLAPLTKDQYSGFVQFNNSSTATYVADMQAQSNPTDINDPYSLSSSLASAFYNFGAKLNIFHNSSNILSAPAAILSSLNPSKYLASNALADDTSAETSFCQDEYLQNHNLATSPFCNVKYGLNDIPMLETRDPDEIIHTMYTSKQIDDNGDPVPGSAYDTFKSTCIDNTDGKFIGDIGDNAQHIDPSCYDKAQNDSDAVKMFRLYYIDTTVNDTMDQDTSNSSSDNVSAFVSPSTTSPLSSSSLADTVTTSTLTSVSKATLPSLKLACLNAEPSNTLSDFKPFAVPPSIDNRNQAPIGELNYNA